MGEENFKVCSMSIGIVISFIFTACYVVEHWYFSYVCLPWFYYFKTLKPIVNGHTFFDNLIVMASVIFNGLEFIFFTIIIFELLRHQHRVSNLMSPALASNSSKRNAVTAIGHLISWLLECLVFGVCKSLVKAYNTSSDNADVVGYYEWNFILLIPTINYFIFPFAQVFTSPQLRSFLFSTAGCDCDCYCSSCTCADGDQEEGGPPPPPVAIEMQPLANGHAVHM